MEWSRGVEWSLEWSGVELEFGVESSFKQNNAHFCMGLCYEKVNIIAITFVFRTELFGSVIALCFTRFTHDLLHYISQ